MITLRAPYKTRPIRFLHLAEHQGWQVKVYGIRFKGETTREIPDPQIVQLAEEAMLALLPQPALTESRYGVGFLIIHQGEHRNWLLLDWWYDQEILKQIFYSSPLDAPGLITESEHDSFACTWELAVHGFERQAWIDTVLNNTDGPDIGAYLNKCLHADI